MKTIAIINDKGGVAKTVTAVNVAAVLGRDGCKVLLIDLDRQANATEYLSLPPRASSGAFKILTERCSADDLATFIEPSPYAGVFVIAAGEDLDTVEQQIANDVRMPRETRIKRACDLLAGSFDYIIIDCPPSLKAVAMNAMVAADLVVIPVFVSQFAVSGINTVMKGIESVRDYFNENIKASVLFTIVEETSIQKQVRDYFAGEDFPRFNTYIRKTTRIVESTFAHSPIIYYDPTATAAQDYIALASELKGVI